MASNARGVLDQPDLNQIPGVQLHAELCRCCSGKYGPDVARVSDVLARMEAKGQLDDASKPLLEASSVSGSPRQWTALQYAVVNQQKEITQFLLKHKGIQVNEKEPEGKTALHLISLHGSPTSTIPVEFADMLLQAGANPTLRDSKQRSFLHYAAEKGQADIVNLALSLPTLQLADILDLQDRSGLTPLHCACEKNYKKIVGLLYYAGCQTQLRSYQTGLAMDYPTSAAAILRQLISDPSEENSISTFVVRQQLKLIIFRVFASTEPNWLNLETIALTNCDLCDSDIADLARFHCVQRLRLDGNKVTTLPSWLASKVNLANLSVADNDITCINGWPPNIKYLSLRNNKKLNVIPAELVLTPSLTLLDVSGTALSSISMIGIAAAFRSVRYLIAHDITGLSTIESDRANATREAPASLISHFRQLSNLETKDTSYPIRVMVAGESNSHKSALVLAMQQQVSKMDHALWKLYWYSTNKEAPPATIIPVHAKIVTPNDRQPASLRLSVLDLPSHESFRSCLLPYLSEATPMVVLLTVRVKEAMKRPTEELAKLLMKNWLQPILQRQQHTVLHSPSSRSPPPSVAIAVVATGYEETTYAQGSAAKAALNKLRKEIGEELKVAFPSRSERSSLWKMHEDVEVPLLDTRDAIQVHSQIWEPLLEIASTPAFKAQPAALFGAILSAIHDPSMKLARFMPSTQFLKFLQSPVFGTISSTLARSVFSYLHRSGQVLMIPYSVKIDPSAINDDWVVIDLIWFSKLLTCLTSPLLIAMRHGVNVPADLDMQIHDHPNSSCIEPRCQCLQYDSGVIAQTHFIEAMKELKQRQNMQEVVPEIADASVQDVFHFLETSGLVVLQNGLVYVMPRRPISCLCLPPPEIPVFVSASVQLTHHPFPSQTLVSCPNAYLAQIMKRVTAELEMSDYLSIGRNFVAVQIRDQCCVRFTMDPTGSSVSCNLICSNNNPSLFTSILSVDSPPLKLFHSVIRHCHLSLNEVNQSQLSLMETTVSIQPINRTRISKNCVCSNCRSQENQRESEAQDASVASETSLLVSKLTERYIQQRDSFAKSRGDVKVQPTPECEVKKLINALDLKTASLSPFAVDPLTPASKVVEREAEGRPLHYRIYFVGKNQETATFFMKQYSYQQRHPIWFYQRLRNASSEKYASALRDIKLAGLPVYWYYYPHPQNHPEYSPHCLLFNWIAEDERRSFSTTCSDDDYFQIRDQLDCLHYLLNTCHLDVNVRNIMCGVGPDRSYLLDYDSATEIGSPPIASLPPELTIRAAQNRQPVRIEFDEFLWQNVLSRCRVRPEVFIKLIRDVSSSSDPAEKKSARWTDGVFQLPAPWTAQQDAGSIAATDKAAAQSLSANLEDGISNPSSLSNSAAGEKRQGASKMETQAGNDEDKQLELPQQHRQEQQPHWEQQNQEHNQEQQQQQQPQEEQPPQEEQQEQHRQQERE